MNLHIGFTVFSEIGELLVLQSDHRNIKGVVRHTSGELHVFDHQDNFLILVVYLLELGSGEYRSVLTKILSQR